MSLRLINVEAVMGDFRLKSINLTIPSGEYHVILGPSGAGKSLLLELIAGIYPDRNGKIELNGRDITFQSVQQRRIGLLFQDNTLFPHLSVYDNIAFPLRIRRKEKELIRQTIENLANDLNIKDLLDRSVVSLSGGEIQRVALARTLAADPEILLLDEPLSAVDIELRRTMLGLLRQINAKGISIVHVTHDVNEALAVAKTVSVMHQGSIVQQGRIEEVLQSPVNSFVAHFFGIRNIVQAEVRGTGDEMMCFFKDIAIPVAVIGHDIKPGVCSLFIHNAGVQLTDDADSGYVVEGRVAEVNRFLDYTEIRIAAKSDFFVNIDPAKSVPTEGSLVRVRIDPRFIGFLKP